MTDTALRVVLAVKEVDELTKLRKENAELRKEVKEWKGPTELPIIDEYYTADKNLIEDHGWDFGDSDFAMRYDGMKAWSVTRQNDTINGVDHMFTLPYTYHECHSTNMGTGFIKIGFGTHELVQLVLIEKPEVDLCEFDHVDDAIDWPVNGVYGRFLA
jgi:hypothetical protein